MAIGLTDQVIRAARAGLSRANPQLSPLEQQLLFVEVTYGRTTAVHLRAFLLERESAP